MAAITVRKENASYFVFLSEESKVNIVFKAVFSSRVVPWCTRLYVSLCYYKILILIYGFRIACYPQGRNPRVNIIKKINHYHENWDYKTSMSDTA